MEKTKALMFTCVALLVASATAKVSADWAVAASVWTTAADGVDRTTFRIGEEVFVHWEANGDVNITVLCAGKVDAEWTQLGQSGVVSFTPGHGLGFYEIACTGASTRRIAVAMFNVIPELALGPIMAVAAAFLSFGLLRWRGQRAGKRS